MRYDFGIILLVIGAISCLIVLPEVYADNHQVVIMRGSSSSSSGGCGITYSCFYPPLVTVVLGESVTWVNYDTDFHTVSSGTPEWGTDGQFASWLIAPQGTFSQSFTRAGVYWYFDVFHPWMKGMVVVGCGERHHEPSGSYNAKYCGYVWRQQGK